MEQKLTQYNNCDKTSNQSPSKKIKNIPEPKPEPSEGFRYVLENDQSFFKNK